MRVGSSPSAGIGEGAAPGVEHPLGEGIDRVQDLGWELQTRRVEGEAVDVAAAPRPRPVRGVVR